MNEDNDIARGNSLPLRVMLAFSSSAYERRFVDHYVAFYFRYAQASLVLGLLLVFGDFAVDYLDHPALQSNFLRLEVCLPVFVAALAYSFAPRAKRHWQPAMAGFIVTMALSLFWILLRIDAEGGVGLKTWVGILNFTFLEFYCFVILGVQFRYALAAGLLILVAFEAAMWSHSGLSAGRVAYWSYHVVTLFILAAGVGWWREFLLRKEFMARTSLDEAREAAESQARIKGEFLATMSHEIRTPMNGVLGMTELLLDSSLDETQRRHAQTIRRSGEALLTILNDILDFSKLEAGRVDLDPIRMDVRDLGEEALQLLALQAQQKGLELACRVAPDVPAFVRADPTRLRQILLNLMGNAVKFTHSGEVTLAIERVTEDAVAAAPDDCVLRFSVIDNGIGISEEAQRRLFQSFVQADGSTTRRYGGTGLGLAVSKQLTEMMGGEIGVDSQPGRGSTFWFTTRAQVLAGGAPAESADLRGIRVLVVDSATTHRAVVQEQIAAMGALCGVAADGVEGLAILSSALADGSPCDVAIVDETVPGTTAIDLLRAVRADPRLRGTALVLLGSLSEAGHGAAARAAGADLILSKPVRRGELGTALANLAGGIPSAASVAQTAPARTRLAGRVLLVEDNVTNQAVATALLKRLGVSVVVANDGAQGVALTCRSSPEQAFDLIVMDCQMPGMDGFEATGRIRAWERGLGHGAPMPIVALTANALAGDREACVAAGMTDYLSKPFTGAQLATMLSRYLPVAEAVPVSPPAASAASLDAPAAVAGASQPVFDAATLQSLPMVADGSEPGFVAEVLEEFLRGSSAGIDDCQRALAAGDAKTLLRCVHTLKSACAQVGAMSLAALAAEAESRLRGGAALDEPGLARIQAEHRRARAAIRVHLDEAVAATARAPRAPPPAPDLRPSSTA